MIQPSASIAQIEQANRVTSVGSSGSSACILKPVSWLDKTLPQPTKPCHPRFASKVL
jgi:hypothetical protein